MYTDKKKVLFNKINLSLSSDYLKKAINKLQ